MSIEYNTTEIEGKEVSYAVIVDVPSYAEYKELEKKGFDTDFFHVDTSGNDIWEATFWFAKFKEDREPLYKALEFSNY